MGPLTRGSGGHGPHSELETASSGRRTSTFSHSFCSAASTNSAIRSKPSLVGVPYGTQRYATVLDCTAPAGGPLHNVHTLGNSKVLNGTDW
jgi:hypothetical protein